MSMWRISLVPTATDRCCWERSLPKSRGRSHGVRGTRVGQRRLQRCAHAIERGVPVVDHRVAEKAMDLAVVAHDLDWDALRAQPCGVRVGFVAQRIELCR